MAYKEAVIPQLRRVNKSLGSDGQRKSGGPRSIFVIRAIKRKLQYVKAQTTVVQNEKRIVGHVYGTDGKLAKHRARMKRNEKD